MKLEFQNEVDMEEVSDQNLLLKQRCVCVLVLNHSCVLQMCVPLILQDKLPMAESFVRGHPKLEERMLTLLDSWCHPDFSIAQLRRYCVCVCVCHSFCACMCDVSGWFMFPCALLQAVSPLVPLQTSN